MNISSIKTPGVYINEIDAFPPSIANVATAIPAFVGFTEKHPKKNDPIKITSMLEYEQIFGAAAEPKSVTVDLDATNQPTDKCSVTESDFKLYNSLRLFYANGGGICYIVSIGLYKDNLNFTDPTLFIKGLKELEKKDEPTLLLFPDAVSLSAVDLGAVQVQALMQCSNLMDRFAIMDVKQTVNQNNAGNLNADNEEFRTRIGNQFLKYGAAYYPYLQANFPSKFRFKNINGTAEGKVNFKSIYSGDASIVSLIEDSEDIQSDYNTIVNKWNSEDEPDLFYANKSLTLPITRINLNDNMIKCWNLLAILANTTTIKNGNQKTFINNLISINLKKSVQNLFDLKKVYEDSDLKFVDNSDPEHPTLEDVVALPSIYNSVTYNAPWENAGDLVEKNPNPYLQIIKTIPKADAVVEPDPVDEIPQHKEADYALVQSIVQKIQSGIIQSMELVLKSIENYVLDTENNVTSNIPIYPAIISKLSQKLNTVPPSGAIAGIYAQTDATRGVWKAPANVSVNGILGLTDDLNDKDQEEMNIHETGKSINAIRKFTGRGTLVWGARTLDGNSNDWRYVNVRRLANMIEEATKKACMQFVFEPNVAQTWMNVKGMIENYLTTLWNDGALAGAKPEHAFFVAVGLNQTMSAQDILEGRMIVKIGYAPSRPAEFIILEFKQMQQKS